MNKLSNIFTGPLVLGIVIAFAALSSIDHTKFGLWQWCVAVGVVLLIGFVLGALFNFAVFAPIYWLLGKLHSRRPVTRQGTSHEDET